jgi:hypothetical protein
MRVEKDSLEDHFELAGVCPMSEDKYMDASECGMTRRTVLYMILMLACQSGSV